jgi:septum formation protein
VSHAQSPRIILASSSPYRRALLLRLCADFGQRAPDVDESPLAGELPAARALRLAVTKADAAGRGEADALVIGSDQVAELDGHSLDKPLTAERARAQLAMSSARVVHFHTGLCVLDHRSGQRHVHVDHTAVHFRALHAAEIARYVEREQPLDCAGSFKCEGLGISLFERIDSQDPSALIGLPLIALARLLRACGVASP